MAHQASKIGHIQCDFTKKVAGYASYIVSAGIEAQAPDFLVNPYMLSSTLGIILWSQFNAVVSL